MPGKHVLIVEDDPAIRGGLVDLLAHAGYLTTEAADGPGGMDRAMHSECDLILLDLILPGGDGLDILKAVRKDRPTLPVILLTARGTEDQRVTGLQCGADDYVVKPFSPRELLARVEAVLRRSPERPMDIQEWPLPGGRVDLAAWEVRFDDGRTAALSQREVELLRYLACHAGRPISREELLRHVWQIRPDGVETRTIDMHVARLRDKLRDDPTQPRTLRTVRGQGYMLIGETEQ